MEFSQYLSQAWANHATDSLKVSQSFGSGLSLLKKESDIADFATLATHVLGQHLGRWTEGISFLQQLQKHEMAQSQDSQKTLSRFILSLELASGMQVKLDNHTLSEKILIYTSAANAVSEQNTPERTRAFFFAALELAQTGIPKEDPANRALAVTGNNLASTLEEKANRTPIETELMILAAETGRKYWEIAGTWLNLERAEYRLSQSYLKAGDYNKAGDISNLVES
jgi:hypothetical protein